MSEKPYIFGASSPRAGEPGQPSHQEISERVDKLTEMEVIDFLKPLTKNYACPVCGNGGWDVHLPADERYGFVGMPVPLPPHPPNFRLMPCVQIICTVCFNVRLHTLYGIAAQILMREGERPKGDEDDGGH